MKKNNKKNSIEVTVTTNGKTYRMTIERDSDGNLCLDRPLNVPQNIHAFIDEVWTSRASSII